MPCESFFTTATVDMPSQYSGGGGFFDDINITSIGSQSLFLQSFYPDFSCADIEGAIPSFFNQPLATNSTVAKAGAVVNLSNVAASIFAVGNVAFPNGVFRVTLFVEEIGGGGPVNYGYWNIAWNFNGITTDYVVTDLTTYPAPQIIMGDETAGVSSVLFSGNIFSGFLPFQIGMEVNVTEAVQTINDVPGYLGCIIPACGLPPEPTALPVFGPSVKCANFSKIFNPLGISLKDI